MHGREPRRTDPSGRSARSWSARIAFSSLLGLFLAATIAGATPDPAELLVVPVANAQQLAIGDGSLWLTTLDRLVRVEEASGRIVARIALPADAGAIAVAGRLVWVATNPVNTGGAASPLGSLISIDARTDTIVGRPIRLRLPTGIAVAAGRVWVTNGQHGSFGRVSYLDPRTRRVLGSLSVAGAPTTIVAAAGSIWVGESDTGRIVRIDPRRARVVGRFATTGALLELTAARGKIWVADAYRGRVLEIDPATDRIAIARPAPGIAAIAGNRSAVWTARTHSHSLTRLDARTGRRSAPPIRLPGQPESLLALPTAVWVTTTTQVVRVATTP